MIYYLNSKPGGAPGAVKYMANFDFTKSTTDSVNGMVATLFNCTRDSSGVHLTGQSSYISIKALLGIINLPIFTIEVDFGDCNAVASSSHKRLIMWNDTDGFIYRSSRHWCIYSGSGWQSDGSSDINAFTNSTLKMKFYFNHKVEVYKDDTLFYTDDDIGLLTNPSGLYIGQSSSSFYDIYVKALRVYYD